MDTDTPVFVGSPHSQYGVIRKILKQQLLSSELQAASGSAQNSSLSAAVVSSGTAGKELTYEVRLSTSLENVVVDPSDLKRSIRVGLRIHSLKGEQS